jgi:cobalt/nickel transport system permease protein
MNIDFRHTVEDSPLARIDARLKLGITLVVLGLIIGSKGFFFPLAVVALALLAGAAAGLSLRRLCLRLAEPLALAAMLVLIKGFSSGSSALLTVTLADYTIGIYREGIMEGLAIAARICAAVSLVTALVAATRFTDFVAALAWYRVPRLFVEILIFAYRALFMLIDDALVIYNAQRNRLGYAGFRRSLSSFGTLAGSLTLKAFENSQVTTLAMQQRGYDGTMPLLSQRPLRPGELLCACLIIAGAGALWLV